MAAFYLVGYGFFRFVIEFFRQPDPHLGEVLAFLTTGQILSMSMIAVGMVLYFYSNFRPISQTGNLYTISGKSRSV